MEDCIFIIESANIYTLSGSLFGESATGIHLLNNTYLVNMSDTVQAQGTFNSTVIEASSNSTALSLEGGSILGDLKASFDLSVYSMLGANVYGVFVSNVGMDNVTMSDLDILVKELIGEGFGAGSVTGISMSFLQTVEDLDFKKVTLKTEQSTLTNTSNAYLIRLNLPEVLVRGTFGSVILEGAGEAEAEKEGYAVLLRFLFILISFSLFFKSHQIFFSGPSRIEGDVLPTSLSLSSQHLLSGSLCAGVALADITVQGAFLFFSSFFFYFLSIFSFR